MGSTVYFVYFVAAEEAASVAAEEAAVVAALSYPD